MSLGSRMIDKFIQPFRDRLFAFLFPVETDNWLAILRLGLGFQVAVYSLSLRSDWNYLLSGAGNGVVSRNLAEALLSVESHFVPRLGWLVTLAAPIGLSEETVLYMAWVCLFAAGCALLIGFASRVAAIAAWLL